MDLHQLAALRSAAHHRFARPAGSGPSAPTLAINMDEEVNLNDWNPDEATLRRWAYDENIVLSDQDEDLVLHRQEYFAVLTELASDTACPKASYILRTLDFFLMFLVLRGNEDHLKQVGLAIALANESPNPDVRDWAALQERRLAYREGIGPVTKAQALAMGEELLNGISREAEISLIGETQDAWTVQLSVQPMHRHREYLAIDKCSGKFRFSGRRDG